MLIQLSPTVGSTAGGEPVTLTGTGFSPPIVVRFGETQHTELFSVNPDGSGDTLVSAVPAAGNVAAFAWAPDSSRILYLADQGHDDVFELPVCPDSRCLPCWLA